MNYKNEIKTETAAMNDFVPTFDEALVKTYLDGENGSIEGLLHLWLGRREMPSLNPTSESTQYINTYISEKNMDVDYGQFSPSDFVTLAQNIPALCKGQPLLNCLFNFYDFSIIPTASEFYKLITRLDQCNGVYGIKFGTSDSLKIPSENFLAAFVFCIMWHSSITIDITHVELLERAKIAICDKNDNNGKIYYNFIQMKISECWIWQEFPHLGQVSIECTRNDERSGCTVTNRYQLFMLARHDVSKDGITFTKKYRWIHGKKLQLEAIQVSTPNSSITTSVRVCLSVDGKCSINNVFVKFLTSESTTYYDVISAIMPSSFVCPSEFKLFRFHLD